VTLPILRDLADDLGVCDARHAHQVEAVRKAADALEWIATQPMIGPACSWWDMRTKAREALGLPPIMLTPDERRNAAPPHPVPEPVLDGEILGYGPASRCPACDE